MDGVAHRASPSRHEAKARQSHGSDLQFLRFHSQFMCLKPRYRYTAYKYLVGGLVAINFIFPYIGLLIIPID